MSNLANLNRPVVTPLKQQYRGFVTGIPSLGVVSIEFALSLPIQQTPINFGTSYIRPTDCKWDWRENKTVPDSGRKLNPVADSRNIIAEWCLQNRVEWLFFRDDDTIAPANACMQLFGDFQRLVNEGKPVSCIGGHYPSKQTPPHSLILVEGHMGGYENWQPGDIVGGDNTAIGMGCTLIHIPTSIAKLPPPWFKTVESLEEHLFVQNPIAGVEVDVGNDIQDVAPMCLRMTEDVYFIRKCRRIGLTHVYCNTAVICQHQDINTGRLHFYSPQLRRNVWQDGSIIYWFLAPGENRPAGATGALEPFKRPEVVRFDLGTPGKKDGWVTVDLFEKSSDEQVDIRNMRPLVTKYGLADEIRAAHILEHFPFRDTVPVLTEWISALKPGGLIHIEVPDAEWGCENLLKHKDMSAADYCSELYKLIGFQSNEGDYHRCLFTKSYLEQLIRDPIFGLEDITVEFHSYPDPRVQRAIRAWARKPKISGKIPEPNVRPEIAARELVLADGP